MKESVSEIAFPPSFCEVIGVNILEGNQCLRFILLASLRYDDWKCRSITERILLLDVTFVETDSRTG